jgi:hypothetical protein
MDNSKVVEQKVGSQSDGMEMQCSEQWHSDTLGREPDRPDSLREKIERKRPVFFEIYAIAPLENPRKPLKTPRLAERNNYPSSKNAVIPQFNET